MKDGSDGTRDSSRTELRVESLAEFVDAVSQHPTPAWMFRGQARISDPLIPLVQRRGLCPAGADLEALERELLDQFQREAWAHLGNLATELTEWEWLAIAQHHGLPTRLLDWTQNAGAALFFAVEDPWSDEDSAVYCYRDPGERQRPPAPFAVRRVCVYHPPHIAGRFISQRGCFTAHPIDFARRPEWESDLVRVTIPAGRRDEIRDGLRTLGIDRASLFPSLEGIASSIRARTCAPVLARTGAPGLSDSQARILHREKTAGTGLAEASMNHEELTELLLQSLEHEKGGVQVYEAALRCALNDDLREEWEEYLDQTRTHVQILQSVCEQLGLDTDQPTPGCEVIRHLGASLVQAMTMASDAGNREAAQLVACECVVLAETKDHLNWQLIGKCAEHLSGEQAKTLESAYEEVEDEEDEHLYHSKGWCRELWIESLGMKAVLPPPEERKDVKTAIGAARAEQASERPR